MTELLVQIEREGTLVSVGRIRGATSSTAQFCYDGAYLSGTPVPISISLPLKEEPFSPERTKSFFEGLLPEGFTRRSVAQWMHVDEGDYLTILHGLGRECLGALCVTEEGEELTASYEPISEEQIRELAAEGAVKSAELVTQSHLSLTGASGKVGLYYDDAQDAWYLPHGTAPSTHIVKQSHVRLQGIVTNEQLSLLTAAKCGIEIPRSFIINTGGGGEHEVLFATRRYDRMFADGAKRIGSLPCPNRLHQEDFAQAMGIPSAEKYEHGQKGYLRGMFDILRRYSSDPIADTLKLWDILVFDWLIGNTDAHIKNFSLLYSPDQRSVRLAPAYDIVSTVVYKESTRDMAFSIGGVCAIGDITEDSFRMAAREAGIGERLAMRRLSELRECFRSALHTSAGELTEAGCPLAAEIEQRILREGGFKSLMQ